MVSSPPIIAAAAERALRATSKLPSSRATASTSCVSKPGSAANASTCAFVVSPALPMMNAIGPAAHGTIRRASG